MFSEGSYVLNGAFTIEEAIELFSEELGEDIDADAITRRHVRWGFTPEEVDLDDSHCWFICPEGRGAKAVWEIG